VPEAAHFQQVFFLLLDSIADRYFSMAIIVKTKKNNTKEKKKEKILKMKWVMWERNSDMLFEGYYSIIVADIVVLLIQRENKEWPHVWR